MAPFSSLTKTNYEMEHKSHQKWREGVEGVASLRNQPHSLDPCLV